jgi:hypothetical protein
MEGDRVQAGRGNLDNCLKRRYEYKGKEEGMGREEEAKEGVNYGN